MTRVDDMDTLSLLVSVRSSGIDFAEICGGEGRATQIGVRHRLRTGPNFDLVCDCDLTKKKDQESCFSFFRRHRVLVAVMAPICGPYGPMSNLNWYLYPETMRERLLVARPVAQTCGQVALTQLGKRCHFLMEQPHQSQAV